MADRPVTVDEVIAQRGWTDAEQARLLRAFIDKHHDWRDLLEFLRSSDVDPANDCPLCGAGTEYRGNPCKRCARETEALSENSCQSR